MNPAPQYVHALVSAIQARLTSGADVAIAGFGRLQHWHEPARVDTTSDGQKILLPPTNTIHFAPDASLEPTDDGAFLDALADAFPRGSDFSRQALDEVLAILRQQLDEEGELVLDGVGRFRTDVGSVSFEPSESLATAVNNPFAGLPPIATSKIEESATAADPSEVDENPYLASENSLSMPDATMAELPSEQTNADTVLDALQASLIESDRETNSPRTPIALQDGARAETEGATEENPRIHAASPDGTSTGYDPATKDEAASIDDDIDAFLSGVWVTAGAMSEAMTPGLENDEPVATEHSESESVAEFEAENTPPPFSRTGSGTAIAAASAVLNSGEYNHGGRHANRTKRNRAALLLIPAVVALCVLAVVVLWPRLADDRIVAESGGAAALDEASEDSLFATHAGGTSNAEADEHPDPATFESTEMIAEDDTPTTVNEATVTQNPESAVAAPAPGRADRIDTPTPNALPQQLRGPSQVNPAQGGSTWILASGNRTSAEELAARYRAEGYRSSVLAGEANGLTVYRVAVGQFGSADEARGLRSRLPAGAPPSTWVLNF